MIIVFHTLYFIVRYLAKIYHASRPLKNFHRCHLLESEVIFQSSCTVDDAFNVSFDPPVFKQRYAHVQQILLNEKYRPRVKKVVEFGCSELKFFIYLKHLFGISEIICVDIDKELLVDSRYRVHPLTVDYLKRRSQKLKVQLLCGSVSDPDSRLLGADAVIGIELIEHLYPDDLEALPYNIFGFIQPLLVIFTTPNEEFNVVFGRAGFRHYDHKFEWTRDQFQDWCLNVIERFPNYEVFFDGVGNGPPGTEYLGNCSQIAVFIKEDYCADDKEPTEQLFEVPRSCRIVDVDKFSKANIEEVESSGICTYLSYSQQLRVFDDLTGAQMPSHYYTEIEVVEYPFTVDNRTPERRILDEVLYRMYSCAVVNSMFYNGETDRIEYPLNRLVTNEEGYFTTVTELKTLLEQENFTVEECTLEGPDEKTLCVVYDLTMDNKSSTPGSDDNSSDENTLKVPWSLACVDETDWDGEYNQSLDSDEKKPQDQQENEEAIQYRQHCIISNEETADFRAPGTSANTKKGTNVKNRRALEEKKRTDVGTKLKKNTDLPVKDSFNSGGQGTSSSKSTRSVPIPATRAKSTSKRSSSKIEDSSAGTSGLKKKRKTKKIDEEKEDDIKHLTECIIYNSLNHIPESYDELDQTLTSNDDTKNLTTCTSVDTLPLDHPQEVEVDTTPGQVAVREIVDDVLMSSFQETERLTSVGETAVAELGALQTAADNVNELNMASREALFDPNSEIDMLDEFEIPNPIPAQHHQQHQNVILIGLNLSTDEEAVVIPESTDPFPNWLLQLLGANVEEAGESHDEPHFYCQGDGIGVHPSIIEVEIDEETTSDSTSSNDEAVAEHPISDSVLGTLPNDENESSDGLDTAGTGGRTAEVAPPTGPNSATESADEYFDTIEEETVYTDSIKFDNSSSDI